jgi:hypothetical protein
MDISHGLQCKIKGKINQVQIKMLKISTVDNFHLVNSSKRYHVYKHTTIHLLEMKYGHYGSNTLIFYLIWSKFCEFDGYLGSYGDLINILIKVSGGTHQVVKYVWNF